MGLAWMGSEEFSPFLRFYISLLFFVFFVSFFFAFLLFSLRTRGKRLQFTAKLGNFTPTPSVPTPCKTTRI